MIRFLCVLALALALGGCVSSVGPYIRDVRVIDGRVAVTRCVIQYHGWPVSAVSDRACVSRWADEE